MTGMGCCYSNSPKALGSGERLAFFPAVRPLLVTRKLLLMQIKERKSSPLPSTLMFSFCLLILSHSGRYLSWEGILAVGT